MIRELDVVSLTHDITNENLKAGDTGTVVHIYADGAAYEVEFTDSDGMTIAVLTLTGRDVRFAERPTREVG
jgi:hypothetical protein